MQPSSPQCFQREFGNTFYAGTGSAWHLGTEAEFAAKYPFLSVNSDRAAFLEFALKFLLYQPVDKRAAQEKAATEAHRAAVVAGRAAAVAQLVGVQGQQAAGVAPTAAHLPAPPGMAWQDVPRIEGRQKLSRAVPSFEFLYLLRDADTFY